MDTELVTSLLKDLFSRIESCKSPECNTCREIRFKISEVAAELNVDVKNIMPPHLQ